MVRSKYSQSIFVAMLSQGPIPQVAQIGGRRSGEAGCLTVLVVMPRDGPTTFLALSCTQIALQTRSGDAIELCAKVTPSSSVPRLAMVSTELTFPVARFTPRAHLWKIGIGCLRIQFRPKDPLHSRFLPEMAPHVIIHFAE